MTEWSYFVLGVVCGVAACALLFAFFILWDGYIARGGEVMREVVWGLCVKNARYLCEWKQGLLQESEGMLIKGERDA